MQFVDRDCNLCSRLCAFREANKLKIPAGWNGAVPSFGDINAKFLIIGLAPGLKGANTTGLPFTNDYAGDILYPALQKFGFASGEYNKKLNADSGNGLKLKDVRITNCVRCVPPENKPTNEEVETCGKFLHQEIFHMVDNENLQVILCLGAISHKALLKCFGLKISDYKFAHSAQFVYETPTGKKIIIIDSYHTSKFNLVFTKILTVEMFENIIFTIKGLIK